MEHKINSGVGVKTLAYLILLSLVSTTACALSFDVSPSMLNYTTVHPGDSTALPVTLYLRSNKSLMCSMSAEESIKKMAGMDVNPLPLAPYTAKSVYVNLTVPADAEAGVYNSKVYFSITEPSGLTGMSFGLGVSIPVSVYVKVLANATKAYSLTGVGITGGKNMVLVVNESNMGSSLLVVEHSIKTSRDGRVVKTLAYKNNLLPFNSKTTELDLNTSSLSEGTYDVQLSIRGKDIQEDRTLAFTIIPSETTTTQPVEETPTTTQPAPAGESSPTVLYITLIMAAVAVALAAVYLLLRRR